MSKASIREKNLCTTPVGTRVLSETKMFEVKTGRINIADPCHSMGSRCGHWRLPAMNGQWECNVDISNEGEWGLRVASLQAWHTGRKPRGAVWGNLLGTVDIDTGTVCICDTGLYSSEVPANDLLYQRIWLVVGDEDWGIFYNMGVASKTGVGDGCYDIYAKKTLGKITAVKILFIDTEDGI